MEQILVNLVNNAIKYTPDCGKIFVTACRNNDSIQLTVKNSGIGIPAEDLSRIFERFYRIDKARARSISGTGLGLAIVKQLVDGLGGTVEVESKPDVWYNLFLLFAGRRLGNEGNADQLDFLYRN